MESVKILVTIFIYVNKEDTSFDMDTQNLETIVTFCEKEIYKALTKEHNKILRSQNLSTKTEESCAWEGNFQTV